MLVGGLIFFVIQCIGGGRQPKSIFFLALYQGHPMIIFGEICVQESQTALIILILQGCRDGPVVRALAFHQCGPGLIPRSGVICGLHREVFPGYSGFPSPQKPTFDLICLNC